MRTTAERYQDTTDPAESIRPCWECGADRGMLVDADLNQARCFECGYYDEGTDDLSPWNVEACPECGTSQIYERVQKRPTYRCVGGHTFNQPSTRQKKRANGPL